MTLTPTRAAPVDNLVRSLSEPVALRASADGDDGRTLFGHLAVFNQFTEINSLFEGRFLERIAPGAFERTIKANRDRVKVLYDHGKDQRLGNRPLGTIDDLREDKKGAYYEVRLYEAMAAEEPLLMEALRSGTIGASFRFSVVAEEWVEPRMSTKQNPEKLPERTITDLNLYEFGPVTFPAYESASAGVRSMTDEFFESLLADPLFVARFTERVGLPVAERIIGAATQAETPDEEEMLIRKLADIRRQKEDASTSDGTDDIEVPPTEDPDESTPPDVPHDEEPGSGDRAAHGPTEPRTFTYAERQHHRRLILARQAGLGGN